MASLVVLEQQTLREIALRYGSQLVTAFPFLRKFVEMVQKDASGGCGCGKRSSLAAEAENVRRQLATMSPEDKNRFKQIIGAETVVVSYRDGSRVRMVRF